MRKNLKRGRRKRRAWKGSGKRTSERYPRRSVTIEDYRLELACYIQACFHFVSGDGGIKIDTTISRSYRGR